MKISANTAFYSLCDAWNIPHDLNISCNLPDSITQFINRGIIINEIGLIGHSLSQLTMIDEINNESIVEDDSNHFHIDGFEPNLSAEMQFRYGICIIIKLAEQARQLNLSGICFTYVFQTVEMANQFEQHLNFEGFKIANTTSDRISFHKIRDQQPNLAEISDDNAFYTEMMLIVE